MNGAYAEYINKFGEKRENLGPVVGVVHEVCAAATRFIDLFRSVKKGHNNSAESAIKDSEMIGAREDLTKAVAKAEILEAKMRASEKEQSPQNASNFKKLASLIGVALGVSSILLAPFSNIKEGFAFPSEQALPASPMAQAEKYPSENDHFVDKDIAFKNGEGFEIQPDAAHEYHHTRDRLDVEKNEEKGELSQTQTRVVEDVMFDSNAERMF